jgi:hypothetical protein
LYHASFFKKAGNNALIPTVHFLGGSSGSSTGTLGLAFPLVRNKVNRYCVS